MKIFKAEFLLASHWRGKIGTVVPFVGELRYTSDSRVAPVTELRIAKLELFCRLDGPFYFPTFRYEPRELADTENIHSNNKGVKRSFGVNRIFHFHTAEVF